MTTKLAGLTFAQRIRNRLASWPGKVQEDCVAIAAEADAALAEHDAAPVTPKIVDDPCALILSRIAQDLGMASGDPPAVRGAVCRMRGALAALHAVARIDRDEDYAAAVEAATVLGVQPADPAAQTAPAQPTLRDRLQSRCIQWDAYWRAPDAHGVILTVDQATELLVDALGVEVDIEKTAPPAQPGEPQARAQQAPAGSAQPVALPHPGSPEASAMMDSVLAEYGWPANHKNAARAGYEAARRMLTAPTSPTPPCRPA
jgi:hypothetical protein